MTGSYLIIGGSSDIALDLINQLCEAGHTVTTLARDASRVEPLKAIGVNVVIGDGLVDADLATAIEVAKEHGNGSIAGAAHLIGSILLKPPHALKVEDFQSVIQTNLVLSLIHI